MDEPPAPQGWAVTPGHEGRPLGFRASSGATLRVSGGASASSFLLRGYRAARVGEPAVKGTRRLESPCLAQGPPWETRFREGAEAHRPPALPWFHSNLSCVTSRRTKTPRPKKQKTNLTIK